MNETMRELATYDQQLFVRINCMPLFLAFEVKYHSLYIVEAERSQKKEGKTLLTPRKSSAQVTADVTLGNIDQDVPIPRQVLNDDFRTLVDATLLIRGELHDSPGQSGLHVSQEEAAEVITKTLHFFLSVLIGGHEVLDDIVDDQDDE
ncbi:hypothetical protein JTB14_037792 [Gonioctena quinquepunctata]|nr:hypothetical protein JTB14_037792 [Gonioctena quinquepunctata]